MILTTYITLSAFQVSDGGDEKPVTLLIEQCGVRVRYAPPVYVLQQFALLRVIDGAVATFVTEYLSLSLQRLLYISHARMDIHHTADVDLNLSQCWPRCLDTLPMRLPAGK